MKAIVANVLFGSILGCLGWTNSAYAKPPTVYPDQFEVPESPVLSAKLLSPDKLLLIPQIFNLVDRTLASPKGYRFAYRFNGSQTRNALSRIFTIDKSNTADFTVDREAEIVFRDRFYLNLSEHQGVALEKSPYTHKNSQGDLILGFQKTFWESPKKGKYWGITTIEHWGERTQPKSTIDLSKLNYTKLTPPLPRGNSSLTVSGGGNKNLAKRDDTSREFDQFRGGISYHHGVLENVTMGVGFVYEDFLVGFTQLTYNSENFPLKTTVSLLAKESGVDFRSHVRFKPAENFVLNYYHDRDKDKFDASWNVFSGLTLVADGDTKRNKFSTGIKVAVRSDYMSISAKAALDSNNNLQWNLKSNIGGLQFTHGSSKEKSTSKIDLSLVESKIGFQCSAFVKYESEAKHKNEPFMVWGSKLQSGEKITPDRHMWSVNLGYGTSSYGSGLIASGSFLLKPSMHLKLSYQEISATSDDTKIKLEISSK